MTKFKNIAVDSRDILKWGERLYIDSSGHPSLLGWIYILQHLNQRSPVDLDNLAGAFESGIREGLCEPIGNRKILITGDSKFTRLLDRFIKVGIISLPEGCTVLPVRQALSARDYDECIYFPAIVTYSLDRGDIIRQASNVSEVRVNLKRTARHVSVLFYDNWAFESISKRKDYLNLYVSRVPEGRTVDLEANICGLDQRYRISESVDFEGLVELNNTLLPTALGIFEFLIRAVSGCSHEDVVRKYKNVVQKIYSQGEHTLRQM